MTSLSESSAEALELAREWASHHAELAELEEQGWRFAQSHAGIFVAERIDGRGQPVRLYAESLEGLIRHVRARWRRANSKRQGETNDV